MPFHLPKFRRRKSPPPDAPDIAQPDAPPAPLPKEDLVQSFDALALSGKPKAGFVGGFADGQRRPEPSSPQKWVNVNYVNQVTPPSELLAGQGSRPPSFPTPDGVPHMVAPLPRPPAFVAMPIPNLSNVHMRPSLTMQHALSAPPNSAPLHAPQYPGSISNPATPSPTVLHPQAPAQATPSRPRASSTPPTPTTPTKGKDEGFAQCSGTTKKSERCTRLVKSPPAYNLVNPDVPIERFCFQHITEILSSSGFYPHNGTTNMVMFADYIPNYLQPDTQAALRAEMEKPRSSSDEPGYIYTFEIRDPSAPDKIHLKVGRAVNLVKRIDQWGKQCDSKEQILRGWWPRSDAEVTSLLKGRVKPGEPGPCCHRLERLVHLELADLVLYAPYLIKGFSPTLLSVGGISSVALSTGATSAPGTPVGKKKKSPGSSSTGKMVGKPCPDCGAVHKEIFSLTRPKGGPYECKEWEKLVKPVIDKWGDFVRLYV